MIFKRFLIINIFLAITFISTQSEAKTKYEDQVVSLSITYQAYSQYRPWSKTKPMARNAYAVVVDGPLLLTSAQMVANATLIQVEKHGGPAKTPAKIVHVDREVNLALLTVENKEFFEDLKPVSFSKKLKTDGTVHSVRWKNRQLDISTSRVGRIEVRKSITGIIEYALLTAITDLSHAGWAEPVFSGSKMMGITVSQTKEKVAYILPSELIQVYIANVKQASGYPGFAALDISWQSNRDPAVAAWLGMKGTPTGIVIQSIPYGSAGYELLQPRDILLSLDNHPIDAEGYYNHPDYGRLKFTNIIIDAHKIGDIIPIQILRNGKVIDSDMELKGHLPDLKLIPSSRPDHAPPYLIAGGLIFRELDYNYLRAPGSDWKNVSNPRLVTYWYLGMETQKEEKQKRIIILSNVLADQYNIGYHHLNDLAVDKVNGQQIDSMTDLENAFNEKKDGFHSIEFYTNQNRNEVILDAEKFKQATERIISLYNIPSRIRLEKE